MFNPADAMGQFQAAMQAFGLASTTVQPDGQFHRCDAVHRGRKGANDGYYILHLHANFAAGGFGDFGQPEHGFEKWKYKRPGWHPSVEEQREIDAAIEQARNKYEKEKAELRVKAWQKAKSMWNAAEYAFAAFEYCRNKQVEPSGLKRWQFADGGQVLLVPMYNSDNKLRNLQFIHADGGKHGLTGGQQGDCHFWIAKPKRGQPICICEGWATGASIHQATGYGVVVAFNAGNLLSVAQWVREQYPEDRIILCADDDQKTDARAGNPGITRRRTQRGRSMACSRFLCLVRIVLRRQRLQRIWRAQRTRRGQRHDQCRNVGARRRDRRRGQGRRGRRGRRGKAEEEPTN